MANPTIAALRAASAATPAGPSGTQALNYAWMNTPGQALVMPVRPPPPRNPKARPPLDPAPRPTNPAPSGPGVRPPGTRPPPRDLGEPGGRYFLEDRFFNRPDSPVEAFTEQTQVVPEAMPNVDMDYGLLEYTQPLPFAQLAEEPVVQQAPKGQRQRAEEFGYFAPAEDFSLMQYIQPVDEAPAAAEPVAASQPAVEVAPSPLPYMPQIVELETPPFAPAPQPVPPPVFETLPDLSLMQYIQPMPVAEATPQAEVAPQSELSQQDINDMLMQYYMTQGFDRMEML